MSLFISALFELLVIVITASSQLTNHCFKECLSRVVTDSHATQEGTCCAWCYALLIVLIACTTSTTFLWQLTAVITWWCCLTLLNAEEVNQSWLNSFEPRNWSDVMYSECWQILNLWLFPHMAKVKSLCFKASHHTGGCCLKVSHENYDIWKEEEMNNA